MVAVGVAAVDGGVVVSVDAGVVVVADVVADAVGVVVVAIGVKGEAAADMRRGRALFACAQLVIGDAADITGLHDRQLGARRGNIVPEREIVLAVAFLLDLDQVVDVAVGVLEDMILLGVDLPAVADIARVARALPLLRPGDP